MTRAASQSNLANIRKGLDAFNRKDLEGIMETCHEDAEFRPIRTLLEGSSYRGEAGLRQFLADMTEEWEEFEVRPDEIRDFGDKVLVLGRMHAKGRASGVEADWPIGWVCDMRYGRTARLQAYTDLEEAIIDAEGKR